MRFFEWEMGNNIVWMEFRCGYDFNMIEEYLIKRRFVYRGKRETKSNEIITHNNNNDNNDIDISMGNGKL